MGGAKQEMNHEANCEWKNELACLNWIRSWLHVNSKLLKWNKKSNWTRSYFTIKSGGWNTHIQLDLHVTFLALGNLFYSVYFKRCLTAVVTVFLKKLPVVLTFLHYLLLFHYFCCWGATQDWQEWHKTWNICVKMPLRCLYIFTVKLLKFENSLQPWLLCKLYIYKVSCCRQLLSDYNNPIVLIV